MGLIDFKSRNNDMTITPMTGEEVKIKGFDHTFAATNYIVGEWVITETKYGIKLSSGKTKQEAIKKLKMVLSQFVANDVYKTPQESFTSALKFRMRQAQKEITKAKYINEIKAVYGDSIVRLFHPLFGFDILKFSDIYYPQHAQNDLSLKQMITDDKGARMAAIIKAVL